MNSPRRHATLGAIGIAVLGAVVAASSARAMVCTTAPVCTAKPGSLVCSNDSTKQCFVNADCPGGTCISSVLGIAGTVSTSGSVSNIQLQNPGTDNLTLTTSGLGSANATFRVVQTNPSSDAVDEVVATTSSGQCFVPVSFKNRVAGAPSNEVVCPLAENYSLTVVSGPSSPGGFTACSSHPAVCTDVPPSGYDFPAGSRFLTVRSPIASAGATPDVVMDLTQSGGFDNRLRFLFSRSTNAGQTFSPFTDITSSVTSGSTIIRGTGQWSDVKVIVATPIGVPTLSQWGAIILGLLLMTASSVLVTRLRPALAAEGLRDQPPPLFVPKRYARTLAGTAMLAAAASIALAAFGYRPNATDVLGSVICTGIIAYLLHLWSGSRSS